MKKVILLSIMLSGIYSQAAVKSIPANTQKECNNFATAYSRKVSGDSEITESVTVKVVKLVTGVLVERAYFNEPNYTSCKSKIEKGDYSCNSVTVDYLFNEEAHECIFVGYDLGDGNG